MANQAPAAGHSVRLPDEVTHDVSVVIVSYNTRDLTMDCVRSVLEHADELSVEVIVVDNQSRDGSSEALRAAFPQIVVIDSPANGGFSYGNAVGVEQAHGRYILLLNPDTRVFAGGLERCIALMEADPDLGIIGPRVLLEDGSEDPTLIRFYTLSRFALNAVIPHRLMTATTWLGDPRYAGLDRGQAHSVDAVAGCYMFARREVFEQAGGLDTRFFMYGEEVEWCHRVRRHGFDIRYTPDVEIFHLSGASTKGASAWSEVETIRGHILFLLFTRGAMAARLGSFLIALRELMRGPYFLFDFIRNGFSPTQGSTKWWARAAFALKSIVDLPRGQAIELPDPHRASLAGRGTGDD